MVVRENPHLLGQIALEAGFITHEQLEECLALQSRGKDAKPLGWILLEAGYLSEAQFGEALRIQQSRFERLEADPDQGGLFGQLAVRLGYLTSADLHQTLREQEVSRRGGSSLLLGQMLVQKKHITPDQFLDLLRRQRKDVASCSACHAFYDLTGYDDNGAFHCQTCGVVLRHAHPIARTHST